MGCPHASSTRGKVISAALDFKRGWTQKKYKKKVEVKESKNSTLHLKSIQQL